MGYAWLSLSAPGPLSIGALLCFLLRRGEAGVCFLSSRFQPGVPQRVLHTSVCKDVGQPPITHLGLGNFWGKEEQDRLKVLIEERYRK